MSLGAVCQDVFNVLCEHLTVVELVRMRCTGNARLHALVRRTEVVNLERTHPTHTFFAASPLVGSFPCVRRLVTRGALAQYDPRGRHAICWDTHVPTCSLAATFSNLVFLDCCYSEWLIFTRREAVYTSTPHLTSLRIRLHQSRAAIMTFDQTSVCEKLPPSLVTLSLSTDAWSSDVWTAPVTVSLRRVRANLSRLVADDPGVVCAIVGAPPSALEPALLTELHCNTYGELSPDDTTWTIRDAFPHLQSLYVNTIPRSASECRLELTGTCLTRLHVKSHAHTGSTSLFRLPRTLTALSLALDDAIIIPFHACWRIECEAPLSRLESLVLEFVYVRWNWRRVENEAPIKLPLSDAVPALRTLVATQRCAPNWNAGRVRGERRTMTCLNRCMTLFTSLPPTLTACTWRRMPDSTDATGDAPAESLEFESCRAQTDVVHVE